VCGHYVRLAVCSVQSGYLLYDADSVQRAVRIPTVCEAGSVQSAVRVPTV
jgi:hypothetical protein